MNFDKSMPLHSSQYSPFQSKRSKQMMSRDDTLNMSPIFNDTSIFKSINDTSLRQVFDESVLVGSGYAGDSLGEAFFEIIQTCKQSDVLETLSRLGQACCDSLELVDPWKRYNIHNYWLAEEANTWRLLHCLFSDTLQDKPEAEDLDSSKPILSQQTLVNKLFESDAELRLLQLLVDWLEASASYQEKTTQTAAAVIGNNIHWGNTLHQLLIGSSLFNKEKNKAMITCMDPDAPRRQKKAIHSDDMQDDNDLCKRIFTEVRCGQFNEAIALCITAGQAWRAAVLQGWRLIHYMPSEDPNTPLEIVGNPSRDLWKWCCLGIANCVTENTHYRATVGVLCGHLPSTLQACQGSWEDLMWAHLRVQIELKVDRFLREDHSTVHASTTTPEVLELLQSEYQPEEMPLQQVFGAVNALMDGKRESHYQSCQRHLMLGHVSAIMDDAFEWLESAEEKFVRFLAHLILVLRQMGKDPQHDVGDKILEIYVSQLIERKADGSIDCPELIAYYTSTVPSTSQITLYADLMDHIYKRECRERVVKAGLSAGVDVAASARVAIKKAISAVQQSYGYLNNTVSQISAADNDKSCVDRVISSLEWLCFTPKQIEEALWLSNAMIRTFIFIGNIDAASSTLRSLIQMFPSLMKEVSTSATELREHLCLKSYLEALEGFGTWYRHFISGQPKDVEPLLVDASFTDKVHHEQRCNQVAQQKARWAAATLHQSRQTKKLLYNILMFPGGWLQDQNDGTLSSSFTEDERKERSKQLETLRRLCIPEMVLLILKVLQSGTDVESHKEAVRLSNLIGGENRSLYKVFTKDKLTELLHRIKESSLFLLENERDPFGYDISE